MNNQNNLISLHAVLEVQCGITVKKKRFTLKNSLNMEKLVARLKKQNIKNTIWKEKKNLTKTKQQEHVRDESESDFLLEEKNLFFLWSTGKIKGSASFVSDMFFLR